jgi:hypothetical protein
MATNFKGAHNRRCGVWKISKGDFFHRLVLDTLLEAAGNVFGGEYLRNCIGGYLSKFAPALV